MKTSPYVIEVKDLYIQKKISWTEQELLLNKYRNADTDEKKLFQVCHKMKCIGRKKECQDFIVIGA